VQYVSVSDSAPPVRPTVVGFLSPKGDDAAVEQRHHELVGADGHEAVRRLETKGRRQVRAEGVSQPLLRRAPFPENIGPQEEVVEGQRLVEREDAERIVVLRVGKGHAARAQRFREVDVHDQIRVGRRLVLADVNGAEAQDVAAVEDAPEKAARGVVVLAVEDGRGGREVLYSKSALLGREVVAAVGLGIARNQSASTVGDGEFDVDDGRGRRRLEIHACLLV